MNSLDVASNDIITPRNTPYFSPKSFSTLAPIKVGSERVGTQIDRAQGSGGGLSAVKPVNVELLPAGIGGITTGPSGCALSVRSTISSLSRSTSGQVANRANSFFEFWS